MGHDPGEGHPRLQRHDLTVAVDGGRQCWVLASYLDGVYATTAHKAQGPTCDRALLLDSDALYRELG